MSGDGWRHFTPDHLLTNFNYWLIKYSVKIGAKLENASRHLLTHWSSDWAQYRILHSRVQSSVFCALGALMAKYTIPLMYGKPSAARKGEQEGLCAWVRTVMRDWQFQQPTSTCGSFAVYVVYLPPYKRKTAESPGVEDLECISWPDQSRCGWIPRNLAHREEMPRVEAAWNEASLSKRRFIACFARL